MKKKNNFFKNALIFLFVIYVGLYIAGVTGYYENATRKDTLETSEQIEKFEQDVASGVILDKSTYLPPQEDYSNVLTKSANAVAGRLSILLSHGSKDFKDFLKTLFIGDIFV